MTSSWPKPEANPVRIFVQEKLDAQTFSTCWFSLVRLSSGPLFSFDVHDDIRLVNDATVEKDEVRTEDFLSWTAHSLGKQPFLVVLLWSEASHSYFCLSLQSHAGKVVLRSWYEKNKHIFPASRWEPYDPEKKWDKYTVRRAGRHS